MLRFQQIDSERWNVFDPLTRQSYRVGLVEHWLLTRAVVGPPPAQLLGKLRRELPQVTLSDEQLLGMISKFRRLGLLPSLDGETPAAPENLAAGFSAWLSSMVVWQIRGVQPDRFLTRLAPHTGWLFSATAVRVWLLAAVLTLLAVLLDFQRLSSRSLSLEWLMQARTQGMLLAVFVLTRGLHELGHALVCKRHGIRCPDIGLFLILGAPCVYCDVSESWQLPRRRQRAAVAAAGMYTELIVATLAAWVWLATFEGPLHILALQTMIVCSISTLVVNANPLMRFDGYYLLADWLDEVNLRSKADRLAVAWLHWLVLGLRPPASDESIMRQRFLVLFSIAGWVYRALLSTTIASLLVAMYAGWQMPWLGRFLAAAILITWWGVPAMKLGKDLWMAASANGPAGAQGSGWRRLRLGCASAACVLMVGLLPLPSRRFASGWSQPLQSQGVYVGSSAHLVACQVRDGQRVEAGQPLFQLRSPELRLRLAGYRAAEDVAAIRMEAATRRRDMHGQDIDLTRYATELEESRAWAGDAQRELDKLTLRAPIAGVLLARPAPPPERPAQQQTNRPDLGPMPSDGGTPGTWCDRGHSGRYLQAGVQLASVCSEESIAVLPLSEEQLKTVAVGTPVRLRISQTQRLFESHVASVVQLDELSSPWQVLASERSSAGNSPTLRFAAVVQVPHDILVSAGTSIDAVFLGQPQTLGSLITSWLRGNLRLLAD